VVNDGFELIGGIEKRPIVLVPYDPEWPRRFAEQRAIIVRATDQRARRVDHVGSTSVPGLSAKPIIDIQVSVEDVDDEASYVPALESAGYGLRVREMQHRLLRTPTLDVHVHVCRVGSDWERRHLLFRDWLRRSSSDRQRYEREKIRLAASDWPSTNHYADAKGPVIGDITRRAEAWAAVTDWSVEQ
jgi:GrpB-like predicted nucleotidyltransferase (UPF0157 family)